MSWTRLSHLRGSGLTPDRSTKILSATRLWEVWGLLPAFSRCSTCRCIFDVFVGKKVISMSYSWRLPSSLIVTTTDLVLVLVVSCLDVCSTLLLSSVLFFFSSLSVLLPMWFLKNWCDYVVLYFFFFLILCHIVVKSADFGLRLPEFVNLSMPPASLNGNYSLMYAKCFACTFSVNISYFP